MNITEFTAWKLAKIDQAAIDARLTDQDFRLLWLILSAADKKTGIARRKQSDLAAALRCSTRGVQISRDRLVSNGYVRPIGRLGGYVVAYDILGKANAASQFKGERSFASDREKANGGGKKGERSFQKGEPPFVHDLLTSLDIPSAGGPRQRVDVLGPLLCQRIGADRFHAWFGEAELVARTDDSLTLAVKSKFIAQYIQNNFDSDILACLPGIVRVEIVVKAEKET